MPEAVIGRTLLATYPELSTEEPVHNRHFPVLREYSANLCGIRLTVDSLPFQEQDTVLAACATVALWTCFHKTAELFHTSVPGPAAITRAASQISHYGRPIPSTGLEIEEICTAIRHIELEPELYDLQATDPALTGDADGNRSALPFASLLYAYLKMKLPVLLVLRFSNEENLHAVTVTGYSELHEPLPAENADSRLVPLFGRRIHEFYAHDDQICPFARIGLDSVLPGKQPRLSTSWRDKDGKQRDVFPRAVIVPVYHKIRLRYTDVLRRVERLDVIMMDPIEDGTVDREWDLHLVLSNDYKRQVREEPFRRSDVRRAILTSPHPRFWWRAALKIDGALAAELLFDATGIARSLPLTEIVWIDENLACQLEADLRDEEVCKVIAENCSQAMLDFVISSLRRRAKPFSHVQAPYGGVQPA